MAADNKEAIQVALMGAVFLGGLFVLIGWSLNSSLTDDVWTFLITFGVGFPFIYAVGLSERQKRRDEMRRRKSEEALIEMNERQKRA